jgi:nucleotide-binding universal stress UspA family protein
MYKRILVATDGSSVSEEAIRHAASLARSVGASLIVLHVVEGYRGPLQDEGYIVPDVPQLRESFDEAARAQGQKILDRAKSIAAQAAVQCEALAITGDLVSQAIVAQAQKSRSDLIVMASHGRRGVSALLLGSETAKVLTHSKIPVLVVR